VYNEFFASMGDPTRESVLARLDAVAGTGIDVFVIDGGWHAPAGSNSSWWDTVGDWEPDPTRFPAGLTPVAAAISHAGLLPGIWIEIESAGAASLLRAEHPEWLMARDGRLVEDNGRFFLDLGNEEAWAYARGVFERLWDTGFRYFKIDYNVDCSIGCDRGGSPGEGLVQHVHGLNRLIDDMHESHPAAIVESCASGGNRLDGLWRHADLCSISDHGVWEGAFHTCPGLAYGLSLVVHPSQMGTWAGVDGTLTLDEIAFRLAAPMLGRVHLTGAVETLDAAQRDLVVEAVAFYKRWRHTIASSRTYHHRAPGHLDDTTGWLAYEVAGDDGSSLLGVWRRDDAEPSIVVHPRGVDRDTTYEVEWYPTGRIETVSGSDLTAGIHCALGNVFTAAVIGMRPVNHTDVPTR
jgi:alpha-galactosidase